jgi:hypothetical protein
MSGPEFVIYRSKRKYYRQEGFDNRTRLAILHHNHAMEDEKRGVRRVIRTRKVYSKAKGDLVEKKKKSPPTIDWKLAIVRNSSEYVGRDRGSASNYEQAEADTEDEAVDEFEFEYDDDDLVQDAMGSDDDQYGYLDDE